MIWLTLGRDCWVLCSLHQERMSTPPTLFKDVTTEEICAADSNNISQVLIASSLCHQWGKLSWLRAQFDKYFLCSQSRRSASQGKQKSANPHTERRRAIFEREPEVTYAVTPVLWWHEWGVSPSFCEVRKRDEWHCVSPSFIKYVNVTEPEVWDGREKTDGLGLIKIGTKIKRTAKKLWASYRK